MSTFAVETPARPRFQVVDLDSVRASDLETFFRIELEEWRERLYWDVSGAITAMRRALERRGVRGKAVRCGSTVVAYAYFLIEGSRGVVTGLSIAPEWRGTEAGKVLVRAVVRELAQRGLSRIESQFVSFEAPWLVPCFEEEGFRTYWRDFRRLPLRRPRPVRDTLSELDIHQWKGWNLTEASMVMQRAHEGGIDAEMNEMYRTNEGCRALLTNVLRHRGCGAALTEASALARQSPGRRAVGFAVVTETSATHAHLAQVAVLPAFQGRGVGHRLLAHAVDRLLDLDLETLSLMVSRENRRAIDLYSSMGFELVLRFPVFSRVF
jgi:ribosomal protein S18 acetylase RimI-like enzyme